MELFPSTFKGKIQVPPSKSYGQRAILIAALSENSSLIKNLGASNDEKAMLKVCEILGAEFIKSENGILVHPIKNLPQNVNLNVGESGLATRLLSGLLLQTGIDFTLNGEGSLLKREQKEIESFLNQYGFEYTLNEGKLPLKVKGNKLPNKLVVDGSQGSQFVSGLLYGFAFNDNLKSLEVKNLVSLPYIDMTLDVLANFGICIENENYRSFSKSTGVKQTKVFTVESDWSSASCWISVAAISKKDELILEGLSPISKQADRKILDALLNCGCKISWTNEILHVDGTLKKAFEFDATNCPDLFPALALLASQCTGISKIKGVSRLKNKESDRALAISEELSKVGISTNISEDYLEIKGNDTITSANFSAHDDHRIAMMCGFLASLAKDQSSLDNPEAVNKSYPAFWKDYESVKIAQ